MKETHIFDVDHTLLRTSTAYCFVKECVKRGLIKLHLLIQVPYYLYKYRQAKLDNKILNRDIPFLRGLKREVLFEMGRKSFEKYAKKEIFLEALELISELKQAQKRVIIATSSFDFLILPVADFLGIENIICSSMEYKNGVCTGNTKGSAVFGSTKKEKALSFLADRNISPFDCIFYSDSYYDLPLFQEIGKKVAINPDRKLKNHAIANGWEIKYYKKTNI